MRHFESLNTQFALDVSQSSLFRSFKTVSSTEVSFYSRPPSAVIKIKHPSTVRLSSLLHFGGAEV